MVDMETLVSLCKRRGFIFISSEIYGGTGSVYDFGPVGVLLKNNVKAAWWKSMVQHRDDRAHRYAPTHGRDELVAGLMVDALEQASDSGIRRAALVHFVERVGVDEAQALRRALAELEAKHGLTGPAGETAVG